MIAGTAERRVDPAASIAGLLLVTEAMVADIPKKDPPPAAWTAWTDSLAHGQHGGAPPAPRRFLFGIVSPKTSTARSFRHAVKMLAR